MVVNVKLGSRCAASTSSPHTPANPPTTNTQPPQVINLKFDEEPRYASYAVLFDALLGAAPGRPVVVETAARVGQKRGRAELEAGGEAGAGGDAAALDLGDGSARKRVRLGQPANQWITVYNKAKPMKQRYHYNVTHSRLDFHVKKGHADGLFISSVACAEDLWCVSGGDDQALVKHMDGAVRPQRHTRRGTCGELSAMFPSILGGHFLEAGTTSR